MKLRVRDLKKKSLLTTHCSESWQSIFSLYIVQGKEHKIFFLNDWTINYNVLARMYLLGTVAACVFAFVTQDINFLGISNQAYEQAIEERTELFSLKLQN